MATNRFWRVYRDEWTVAYVSDADGESGQVECEQRLSRAQSLLPSAECRTVPWSDIEPGRWPWMLEIRLPVMKGEFRDKEDADTLAQAYHGSVVREDSSEDKEIQRKLRLLNQVST